MRRSLLKLIVPARIIPADRPTVKLARTNPAVVS
jgi:hypothetical protein